MNPWRVGLLIVLTLAALAVMTGLLASNAWGPQYHGALGTQRIYAYRGWQSTGVQVSEGDIYTVRAKGSWLYSPFAGPNGPEGHRRFSAPGFYPLPNVGGGALIGRIGDYGQPFYVGGSTWGRAERGGLLYLRIDDDRLGDNEGCLEVQVTTAQPEQ
ncbi:MAG: hypothetical protein JW850_11045 [Thermoflexales bacterium]|nr:hypothetical protein [Thermoflexales bacterium]